MTILNNRMLDIRTALTYMEHNKDADFKDLVSYAKAALAFNKEYVDHIDRIINRQDLYKFIQKVYEEVKLQIQIEKEK